MRKQIFLLFGGALLATHAHAATAGDAPSTAPSHTAHERCIAVVGTNDLHGAIEPYAISATDSTQSATVHLGGVLGIDAYVKALRARYGKRLILVDGGDLFQGTLVSNLSLGRAVIDAYNAIGYTAAAVGNHEFDFGALPHSDDVLSVIKARIAQADFPFLTLNIFDRNTQKPVAWANTQSSILVDAGGIKVGVMGISTVETPTVTKPRNVASLEFKDPVPLIAAESKLLRERGAELVVLVGHVGGKCTRMSDPSDVSSCATRATDAELMNILRAVPPGAVDVAVGGHTHQFMAHWIAGTATIESGARGQFLGYVEACVKPSGGIDRQYSAIHGAIPLCLDVWSDGTCKRHRKPFLPIGAPMFLQQPIAADALLAARMEPYLREVAALESKPIGVVLPEPLGRYPLTDLVGEAMRRVTQSDFAMQNTGGIRTDLPAGPITYGQIFRVLPFDNTVVQVTLSGAEIQQLAELLSHRRSGMPPFIVGAKVTRVGGKLQIRTAKGAPLELTRRYTFSTSDFIVQGGEGTAAVFDKVAADDILDRGKLMRDAFIELLQALYPAQAPATTIKAGQNI